MPRRTRPAHAKRSEQWLRLLINHRPELLERAIRRAFVWPHTTPIKWLSPIESDAFAEYYDQEFLERLELPPLSVPLAKFWPASGPRWDGLGRAQNRVILIEAKAHIDEMVTDPSAASPEPLKRILESISDTKNYLHARETCRWDGAFYQYVNRWAHLYYLRVLNSVDAYLVFIYFTEAPDVPVTATESEWKAAIRVVKTALGLNRQNRLSRFVADVFIPARALEKLS
jgi:hypothetical protein